MGVQLEPEYATMTYLLSTNALLPQTPLIDNREKRMKNPPIAGQDKIKQREWTRPLETVREDFAHQTISGTEKHCPP